jgi:hypothetical protein
MTQDSYELLRELATNDRFLALLDEMMTDERNALIESIHTANVVQNVQAAAMESGKLYWMTRLPNWFSDVYRDTTAKRQSVR